VNKVRWQVGVEMLLTWGLTIPVTIGISAAISWTSAGAQRAVVLANQFILWIASAK